MPAAPCRPHRSRPARRLAVAGVLFAAAALAADPPRPDAPKAGAVKLPDGTIVFFTRNPDEANPPVEGVLLSPQEYKALVEQADQLKKLKDAPRPQPPSRCHIRGKVESRGGRSVAVLTLTFPIHTTAPRTLVALGCQKAFPVAARLSDGKLPVLSVGDDGLTALIEAAGEATLTVDVEVPVGPRGAKGEPGFELGLPRAAITTLALDPPPGAKRVAVSGRTAGDRPTELKQLFAVDPKDLARPAGQNGPALGPVDLVQVTWEAPTAPAAPPEVALTADIDVTVRVDENQVETTAAVRLHGPAKEWSLLLPAGAEVTAERAGAAPRDPTADLPFSPSLTRPADPNKGAWTFRPPEGGGPDWVLTVTARRARSRGNDAKSHGPYPVGPFAVPTAARVSGTVKVYAPPTVRVERFKHPPEVRRQDAPAEEDLAAAFRFTSVGPAAKPPAGPLLEFEARPVPPVVQVQPAFTLRRVPEAGWRLDAEVTVTPFRTEVQQLLVDLPAGWQPGLEAGPQADAAGRELVDGVEAVEGTPGRYAVLLASPHKTPFTLTLTALFPLDPPTARDAALPLPRFPGAIEQAARVTATVPEGLEVRGTAAPAEGGAQPLKPANPAGKGGVVAVVGQFDKGVTRVDLSTAEYRPELLAEVRAELRLSEHQVVVSEVIRFRAADAATLPIRLTGPAGAVNLRASPPLDQPGQAGEWVLRPPADGAREFTLSVSYALPLPPAKADQAGPYRAAVGLLWPQAATRVEASVLVWAAGSARRVAGFDGPWRELPPEVVANHESLPALTLGGSGPNLPLTLELGEATDPLAPAVVERALVQGWLDEGGALAVRGRFRLRQWSAAGLDVELPVGVVPEVAVDGKRVEAAPRSAAGPPLARVVRVPMPEPRAGAPALVDIHYVVAAGESRLGELTIPPPRLPAAGFRAPVRWQVVLPGEDAAVCFDPGLRADLRWGWRHRLLPAPTGARTRDLEQWLADGGEPAGDAGDGTRAAALTGRQAAPGPLRVYRVSWPLLAVGCSAVAFAVGLLVSRLRPGLVGPALGLVGVAVAVLAVGWPQPTLQAASAALPGLVALALTFAGTAAVRWYYRRRVAYLPGFTRTPAVGTGTASAAPSGSRSGPGGSGMVILEGPSSHPQPAPSGS